MPILLSVSILLSVAYAALMLLYLYGWQKLPEWHIPEDWEPTTRVSVIIPARNEATNIAGCLQSIVAGSYPADLLEIIVIDDHSEDDTATIVAEFSKGRKPVIHLLSLTDFITPDEPFFSFKKDAIEAGIAHANGELIVTTDADCIVPVNWLRLLVSRFNPTPNPDPAAGGRGVPALNAPKGASPLPPAAGSGLGVGLLAAPVAFHSEHNLLQHFQSLDFLGLMGITGAGIHLGWQRMGNGANLAYPKVVFEAVGGFEGNQNRASGDDMFLIQKIAARWPDGVFFLKNPDATVLTEAKPDWTAFIRQRLRWGTKNAALPEWPVRIALLTVFLFCWSILINSALAIFSGICFLYNDTFTDLPKLLAVLFFQILIKALFDYIFLREMCRFFRREALMRWFVPSFFLHTLYIPMLGMASLFFKKYEWKGRRVE